MPIVRPIVQDVFIPENYTSSPEIIKNCLQEVLSEGMMCSQVSAPVNNDDMTKKQKENIIKKHMEQFTTKYYESDRRWHSFLPDETLPRKIKPIAKRNWEDLEAVILAYYEEQEEFEKLDNGKWQKSYTVVEHTKSNAGIRTLYVVTSAMELFNTVKATNLQNGYSCEPDDFIFMYRKHRITSNCIDSHFERYCKERGIKKKGNHKARKTALTKIADNPNINLKDAMEWAGHRDVKTFITHYCFSRYSDEQKRIELEKTLNI